MAIAGDELIVSVWTIAGDTINLDLHKLRRKGGRHVSALKAVIAQAWSVPKVCQILIHGTDVLKDTDRIVQGSYQMVVSADSLCSELGQNSRRDMEILRDLSLLGHRGGDTVITAVSSCLAHEYGMVRHSAWDAFKKVAERGSPHALAIVIAYLRHESDDVRLSALQALPGLLDRGDEYVVNAVLANLQHDNARIRYNAIKAVAVAAEKKDEHVIAMVSSCLEDSDKYVRCVSAETLASLSERGDQHVMAKLISCFRDEASCVIEAALAALVSVATRGDQFVLAGIRDLLEVGPVTMRVAAMRALAQASERWDTESIALLRKYSVADDNCHGDGVPSEVVVGTAEVALVSLTHETCGNRNDVEVLLSRVKSTCRPLKIYALQILQQVAERGDVYITSILSEMLEDEKQSGCSYPDVREALSDALRALSSGT